MNTNILIVLMVLRLLEFVIGKTFDQEQITADIASNYYVKESMSVNISTVVGKTIHLNCSMVRDISFGNSNYFHPNKQYDHSKEHLIVDSNTQEETYSTTSLRAVVEFPIKTSKPFLAFNPTWLKADAIYTKYGFLNGYKTENIIVTRKGIIPDSYRDRMRLIGQGDKIHMLKISDVEIRDEGKYICRELNSKIDRTFYVNVLSPIREINIKFHSNSKFFREIYTGNRDAGLNKLDREKILAYGSNTVSIKENDELVITCIVNSSKPSANLSIWILKRKSAQNQINDDENSKSNKNEVYSSNDDYFDVNDSKKLDIIDSYVVNNKDFTLKTVSISKLITSRNDNYRLVSCVAENVNLNEKWESKRILNVLYGPKCSKYQKSVFNTGINQTIDLECHMANANPPYLDFTWNFFNSQAVKERMRSNGFISRISWTPRTEKDFGEIICAASNGIDLGECKIRLELGGPPNPPYDCYHKENNKTIIIECKPGFEQGDPEVYYYLLKRKSNGMLVEYARKRDSCSFLISNLILEEYLNDFLVYSSNKYGSNRDKATKLVIENKEFLLKSTNKLEEMNLKNNKQITTVITVIISIILVFCFVCCLLMRCKKDNISQDSKLFKSYANGYLEYGRSTVNHNSLQFQEPYKYSAHNSQYSSKTTKHLDGKNKIPNSNNLIDDDYFNASETSISDNYEKNHNGVYDNSSFKKSYSKLSEKSIHSPSFLNSSK